MSLFWKQFLITGRRFFGIPTFLLLLIPKFGLTSPPSRINSFLLPSSRLWQSEPRFPIIFIPMGSAPRRWTDARKEKNHQQTSAPSQKNIGIKGTAGKVFLYWQLKEVLKYRWRLFPERALFVFCNGVWSKKREVVSRHSRCRRHCCCGSCCCCLFADSPCSQEAKPMRLALIAL